MSRPKKDPPSAWQPPTTFEEYRVLSPLSRGGMGEVYLGHDTLLDRSVAIKFIGAGTPDVEAREQFLTEARAAARLQHPNVVSVYRVGEWGGRPYIISEYVRGKSLNSLPTPMRWQRALDLGIGLSRGLAAAHRSGVLHRDIKPSNAIISDTDEVKLLDFGLAELFDLQASLSQPLPGRKPPSLETKLATGATQQLSSDDNVKKVDAEKPARQMGGLNLGPISGLGKTPKKSPDPKTQSLAPKTAAPKIPTPSTGVVPPKSEVETGDYNVPSNAGWPVEPSDPKQELPGAAPRIVGTPYYMAPEIWNGEPSTRQSDIYAMGALLFELLAGSPPHYDPLAALEELRDAANHQDAPPLIDLVPDIEPRLSDIVARCLRRTASERYASGDELREALEALREEGYKLVVPEGNPYRGLCAFEAEHRSLFFGRSNEIGTVLERLRTEPFILVAADSGVGKSSLCRAGILPLLGEGALGSGRQWQVLSMVPGRNPLSALCEALAPLLRISEAELHAELKDEPTRLSRALHKRLGDEQGVVLFVDQLEEIVTISDPAEAELIGRALGRLSQRTPFARLLMTARSDFLARISTVPSLGDELSRALYFLRPMYPEKIRQAIVGPARKKNVRFESEALVDTLVDETAKTDGGLPLLQFALSELWDVRTGDIITQKSLESIGGVAGALARHADQVIVSLPAEQRNAARHILMRLVTIEGTRARRTDEEIGKGDAAQKALAALLRGRMIIAHATSEGTVYEVAHEALLKGWSTLRRWLEENAESRAVKQRLETAAAEWVRLGRAKETLWSGLQLAELSLIEEHDLSRREQEFIAASEKSRRRGRILRIAGLFSVPLFLALFYGGMQLKIGYDRSQKVAEHLGRGRGFFEVAQHKESELKELRRTAFLAFDGRKKDQGEKLWAKALKVAAETEDVWSRASRSLEAALTVDPSRDDARDLLAEALYESALSAERAYRMSRRNDLVQRMMLYDRTGALKQRWEAQAQLHIETWPAGAKVKLQRYTLDERQKRTLSTGLDLGQTPIGEALIPDGSYLLTFTLPGRDTVRYPVLLKRGETLRLAVELPRHEDIVEGFVYLPKGRFLFGTASEDSIRQSFLTTVPIHELQSPAYLISRFEVTYGDYIEYLNALPPDERKKRSISVPKGGLGVGGVELKETADKIWQLTLQPTTQAYVARAGEEIHYANRKQRKEQDWLRLPVSGIGPDDISGYVRWLDESGHVPGARLCTDFEWERAARGADEREFPHGDALDANEANFDETYGKDMLSVGPDGIGSYPATTSPFGLLDVAGNVFEWVESSLVSDEYVVRGGSYFQGAIAARTTNRSPVDKTFRDPGFGVRICARYAAKK